jgi:hypothetical protein
MPRVRARYVVVCTLLALFGVPAAASAVILQLVLPLLTLFSIVGVTFTTFSGEPLRQVTLHVVPVPDRATECDLELHILDELGQVLDMRDVRARAGEAVSHDYRGRGAGVPERIRAVVKSTNVPGSPGPPGPCPILASLQITSAQTGAIEAILLPAIQHEIQRRAR